jgi:peptide-methionine (R)-S-oxide reductase
MKTNILILLSFLPFAMACSQNLSSKKAANSKSPFPEAHNAQYWKSRLSPNAYAIMVERGTEPPFHNEYFNNHIPGVYVSRATGDTLFTSETKFESGTGWPSFYDVKKAGRVKVVKDNSYGMDRDEVVEAKNGLHLGHVFDDGPQPTGLRYCMNSAALKFIPYTVKGKTKAN